MKSKGEPKGPLKEKKRHGPGFRGGNALRKRCPMCKRLRRFREPPGDQGGNGRPLLWVKVNGRWICKMCQALASVLGTLTVRDVE